MAPTLGLWLPCLAAAACLARGERVTIPGALLAEEEDGANWSSLAEREPEDDTPDEDVDFSFMTNNFAYPGHEAGGVVGTISQWFGGRPVGDDVKEMLVQGHTCQKRGDREQTYYASSMCYWLPEIKEAGQQNGSQHPLLTWSGGRYYTKSAKPLCPGSLSGSGVCAKYSVCHNNAQDSDVVGEVQHVSFVEKVELPEGCLGEKEIESICTREFDEGSKELKAEDTRCQEIKGRFDRATKEMADCTSELQRLPHRIESELPKEIEEAKSSLMKINQELGESKGLENRELQRAKSVCGEFYMFTKGWMFTDGLAAATSTEQFLGMLTPENCNHYERTAFSKCVKCQREVKDVKRSLGQTRHWLEQAVRSGESKISQLEQELLQAKDHLERWEKWQPWLQSAKEAVDHEWLPKQDSCAATRQNYVSGQSSHIVGCAPGFYESSCEKACLEAQAGCGVIEGDRPGSENGRGAVEAPCAPPEPSWIMGPFTHGSKEAAGSQCERISASQGAKYAQKVLKTGWLWKQSRLKKWDLRFFVLESSDQVRSAVLRYYGYSTTHYSAGAAVAQQSVGKGIILWDAKQIKSKSGEQYGWKHGEECFKLVHFYRSYRFCVPLPNDVPFESAGGHETIQKIRDDWMDALADEITHP